MGAKKDYVQIDGEPVFQTIAIASHGGSARLDAYHRSACHGDYPLCHDGNLFLLGSDCVTARGGVTCRIHVVPVVVASPLCQTPFHSYLVDGNHQPLYTGVSFLGWICRQTHPLGLRA